LDASALLAMFRGEPGGTVVAAVLDSAAMTTVNLAEVIGFYARRGSGEAEINQLLGSLPIQLHPFDSRHTRLGCSHRLPCVPGCRSATARVWRSPDSLMQKQ
jgi:PIN domain nuclease of toxin-antitoxin system